MLIGRQSETDLLGSLKKQTKSTFVAVYGRRRVGKTFLIRETYKNRFDFYVSGVAKGNMARQLSNFQESIETYQNTSVEKPSNWYQAFGLLQKLIEKSKASKKVLFIDEMPWMDTPKSEFIGALERFWNMWASVRKDIILIACGSATSWIIKKLINDTGGLHNRVTHQIHVKPFNLHDTEKFLFSLGCNWNRYQIVQTYMCLGGIPFYLEKLKPEWSLTQNIEHLFFSDPAELKNEYNNLLNSLFKKSEKHKRVLEALSDKDQAVNRSEIVAKSSLSNGGGLTEVLDELELCGFISKTFPFGGNVNNMMYQITDHFLLFYSRFLVDKKHLKAKYWINLQDSPTYRQWTGVAYEKVCFNHINQIAHALGISGIQTTETSWRDRNNRPTAQIDLVIDRKDQVVNICEIKFSEGRFSIDKSYAENLRKKIMTFKQSTQTNKAVFLTMITTYPLNDNAHSRELVVNKINMEALFERSPQ